MFIYDVHLKSFIPGCMDLGSVSYPARIFNSLVANIAMYLMYVVRNAKHIPESLKDLHRCSRSVVSVPLSNPKNSIDKSRDVT